MSYLAYVVDCETTGTDHLRHDVIEVCFWRIGDESSKTWHLKPLNPESIEDEALRVNKHKKEDILHKTEYGRNTYLDPDIALPEIEEWIMSDGVAAEDRVFIGQSPDFDYKFLTALWKKTGNKDTFPFGYWKNDQENVGYTLDTIQLARWVDLLTGKKRKFYTLGALVKAFGIKKAQAHKADGDVQMTKDLFLKISEPLKNIVIEKFSDSY